MQMYDYNYLSAASSWSLLKLTKCKPSSQEGQFLVQIRGLDHAVLAFEI